MVAWQRPRPHCLAFHDLIEMRARVYSSACGAETKSTGSLKTGRKGRRNEDLSSSLCRSPFAMLSLRFTLCLQVIFPMGLCVRGSVIIPLLRRRYMHCLRFFVGSGTAGHVRKWASDVPAAVKHGSNTETHHTVSQRSREITLEEHRIPHLLNQYVGTCTPLA